MKYNNKKKIIIKTVQINNKELEKCRSGKEFKVKLVTRSRPIIVDPPRLTIADAMKSITNLAAEMRAGFKRIDNTLNTIIDLNNLKH